MSATRTAEETLKVAQTVADVARPLILNDFRADSCIASTRIAIEVLRYFGIDAKPLPVFGFVFNAEAAKMLDEGADLEQIHEATLAYSTTDSGGPWTIGLGAPTEGQTGWAGHLVAVNPHDRLILDLSIDQINRPHKGLEMEPYALLVDDDDWWDSPDGLMQLRDDQHSTLVVLDRRCPDPEGYKASANWKMTGASGRAMKQVIGQTIREVRDRLR